MKILYLDLLYIKIRNIDLYEYFDSILPVFNEFLQNQDEVTVKFLLSSWVKLLSDLDPNSALYQELTSKSTILQIIKIAKNSKTTTKSSLQYLSLACWAGNNRIQFLIDNNICDVLTDIPLYCREDIDSDLLELIFNLSQTTQKNIEKLCDEGVYTICLDYLKTGGRELINKSLGVLIYLARFHSNLIIDEFMDNDYIKHVVHIIASSKSTPENIHFWLEFLIWLLEKDDEEDSFAIYFQENGGVTVIEDLQLNIDAHNYDLIEEILTKFYSADDIEVEFSQKESIKMKCVEYQGIDI